jgi:hypothetical protein
MSDLGHLGKHLGIALPIAKSVGAHDDRPGFRPLRLYCLLNQQAIHTDIPQIWGTKISFKFLLGDVEKVEYELRTGFELPDEKK